MSEASALPPPQAVAAKFVSVLRAWASDYQWDVMQRRNAEETDTMICHSHDWCDANMAMAEAFESFGIYPLPDMNGNVGDPPSPAALATTDLWNAAWDTAMPALGGKTKAQHEAAGGR